jgi:hypothetical protein
VGYGTPLSVTNREENCSKTIWIISLYHEGYLSMP